MSGATLTAADADYVAAFEACTIPRDLWTHRAHLRMAYCYLRLHSYDDALTRARIGIQKLNAVHKTPELIDRGYHETITVAWMRILSATIRQRGAMDNSDAFFAEQAHLAQRTLLRLFYSRERLISWEAKKAFVEPDLLPLPAP